MYSAVLYVKGMDFCYCTDNKRFLKMKGTGQEVLRQFPNIMLIYGHEAENILVFVSKNGSHTPSFQH